MKALIITGPSGVGKGTFISYLLKKYSIFSLNLSFTTRKPRKGEIDKVHYNFITKQEFEFHSKNNNMLEEVSIYGNSYGVNFLHFQELLNAGKVPVLDIDAQGVQNVRTNLIKRQKYSKFKFQCLCLLPSSWSTLQARLRGRKTQEEDQIIKRLQQNKHQVSVLTRLSKYGNIHYITNFQYQLTAYGAKKWLFVNFPQLNKNNN